MKIFPFNTFFTQIFYFKCSIWLTIVKNENIKFAVLNPGIQNYKKPSMLNNF